MAGRIPQTFIDDLMNRIDIVEVIDARVPLKKTGREYTACCPFHNEKTPSFTVSPTKQFYHCFGCGAHGTALGFLMEYEHLSFPESVEELARQAGIPMEYEGPAPGDAPRRKTDDTLYDLLARVDQFYRRQLRQHAEARRAVDYLKQRGLSGEIAAEFGLGFAPPGWDNLEKELGQTAEVREKLVTTGMLIKKDSGSSYDRFRDRIMFPIRDRRGRTIAFGGRILPDTKEAGEKKPAKYLNSPETPLFHKGRELYGLYEARQALRDIPRLMVVEGYMDVVALAQFGIRYAVATLGTATTEEHLHKLFRLTPEILFCFDGDRAGREAAWRALNNALPVMREGRQIRFMFLPEGEDPDSHVRAVGKAGFEADMAAAQPFSDFLFQHLTGQVDTASIDGRARLVELARPLLTRLPPGIYARMMRQQLAQLARIELAELDRQLDAAGGPSGQPTPPAGQPARTTLRRPPRNQPHSPVRLALIQLLNKPDLAQLAGDPHRFADFDLPGVKLLCEVIEILQQNPNLSSSALLERWRGTESGRHLEKLAMISPTLDEETALRAEFEGAIRRLDQQRLEQRLDALLTRSNQGELNEEEKAELMELFTLLQRDKRHEST